MTTERITISLISLIAASTSASEVLFESSALKGQEPTTALYYVGMFGNFLKISGGMKSLGEIIAYFIWLLARSDASNRLSKRLGTGDGVRILLVKLEKEGSSLCRFLFSK